MIKNRAEHNKSILGWAVVMISALLLFGLSVIIVSAAIEDSMGELIFTPDDIDISSGQYDCILVLGAGISEDGTPSPMLRDRIARGCELYFEGKAPMIIMSGDRKDDNYDEPQSMKNYAESLGVDSKSIVTDPEGYSTYESVSRAKEIFGADKIIIVSQEYHLYRALYIAKSLGIDAVGVSSDLDEYSGQFFRDVREMLARYKDFWLSD